MRVRGMKLEGEIGMSLFRLRNSRSYKTTRLMVRTLELRVMWLSIHISIKWLWTITMEGKSSVMKRKSSWFNRIDQ